MKPNLSKECHFILCEGCNKQGYISVSEFEKPRFIKCSKCGWEIADVWCPKCEMGGYFVEKVEQHPFSWICPECKTQYSLSPSFYKEPVTLHVEENQLKSEFSTGIGAEIISSFKRMARNGFIALIGLVIFFAIFSLIIFIINR